MTTDDTRPDKGPAKGKMDTLSFVEWGTQS